MTMKLGNCVLCQNEAKLCESHIIPESFYAKLYHNERMLGITGVGNKKRVFVQKGLRDYLLCRECESIRNNSVEKPFMEQWKSNNVSGKTLLPNSNLVLKFDLEIFIRYHLFILYLASVATTHEWNNVDLGPHKEPIRVHLFNNTPLVKPIFSVLGTLMVEKDGTVWDRAVFPPGKYRMFDQRCYGLTFGGVRWGYCISSHRSPNIEALSIDKNGDFPLLASLYSEHQHIHDAGRALQ